MNVAERDAIWTRNGVPVEELPDAVPSQNPPFEPPEQRVPRRRRRWPLVLYASMAVVFLTVLWLVITAPLSRALEPLADPALLLLSDDGRLLIADFAPHQREDLRVRDQHARLGFSDAQIKTWFAAAGLDMVSERTLPGGELTVKIWLGRRHRAQVVPIDAAALKGRTA